MEEEEPLLPPCRPQGVGAPGSSSCCGPHDYSHVEVHGPPPPYWPPGPRGAGLSCGVCHRSVSLEGKQRHHVVRCGACSEATPIKVAPAGKKYVRCSCNCLLICRVSSQRIVCPRPHCKRVIGLGPVEHWGGGGRAAPRQPPLGIRKLCGHCSAAFLVSGHADRPFVMCPHCLKVSSIGRQYTRRRSFLWFMILVVMVAALAGTVAVTRHKAPHSPGIYASWAVLVVLVVFPLSRTISWYRFRVSTPL